MHVGRALAKLNPKNVRFDVGAGGIPELTPQDIAAALGCVDDGLGRELLCQVWWPDGAKLSEHHLIDILTEAHRQEWQRREDRMLDAMLTVAMHGGSKGQTAFAAAHAERWPGMIHMEQGLPMAANGYKQVRHAVIEEMKGGNLCRSCGGRAAVRIESGQVCICPKCLGSGRIAVSERSRAQACGMTWEQYRGRWSKVYEWTVQFCSDSLQRAAGQFVNRIGC